MNLSKNIADVYANAEKLNDDELSILVDKLQSLKSRRVSLYKDYPTMLNHWSKLNRVNIKFQKEHKQDYYLITLVVGKMVYQEKCKTKKEEKTVRKTLAKIAYNDVTTEHPQEMIKTVMTEHPQEMIKTVMTEHSQEMIKTVMTEEMIEGINGDSLPFDGTKEELDDELDEMYCERNEYFKRMLCTCERGCQKVDQTSFSPVHKIVCVMCLNNGQLEDTIDFKDCEYTPLKNHVGLFNCDICEDAVSATDLFDVYL